jgi:hypothetical protein
MLGKNVADLANEVLKAHAHVIELTQRLVSEIAVDGELYSITQSLKGAIETCSATNNGNCLTIPDLVGRIKIIAVQDMSKIKYHARNVKGRKRLTAERYQLIDALIIRSVRDVASNVSVSIGEIFECVCAVENVTMGLVRERVRLLSHKKGKLIEDSNRSGYYRFRR